MGNKNSGRPGGNPGLAKFRFKTDNPKPYKVTISLDEELNAFLLQFGDDRAEVIREAIRLYQKCTT
jgi:hypothetical protein